MEKKGKYKTVISILSILLILVGGLSISQFFQRYSISDVNEREELLVAVMWEITKAENDIQKEEIDEIVVLKAKAGVYPLNYDVAINMKNGDQILYSWKNEDKTGVWRSN